MTTISSNRPAGIALTSPGYTNPVTIDAGITVSSDTAGVYAASGTWTLQNGGSITGVGSGVFFNTETFGTVINAGSIAGTFVVGVYLKVGSVSNAASGSITGYNGVALNNGDTLTNAGNIAGTSIYGGGVEMSGGLVSNTTSASIIGDHDGIAFSFSVAEAAVGTVINAGSIAGSSDIGVLLDASCSLDNAAGATITGGSYGVANRSVADYGGPAPATVFNAGYITSAGTGVALPGGGSVTNAASGVITGLVGVSLPAGATLTNAGTIIGIDGTAVAFAGTYANLLVIDPGATFAGLIVGSPSASNALELAVGSGTGTLYGLGSRFVTNFGTVTVDSGAVWDLTGTSTLASGVTLTDAGRLIVGGTLTNALAIPAAITLGSGAVLSNASGGVVTSAGTGAVYSFGGVVTVVNYGSIAGTGSLTTKSDALDLNPNAYVTNATSAAITGVRTGVYIAGTGSVINNGSIAGAENYGVNLGFGGSVTNAAAAAITGGKAGVFTEGTSPSRVVNSGSIAGTGGTGIGVALGAGGSVTNAASASITGYRGVSINGVGTLVNDGTVAGTSGNGDGVTLDRGGSITNASSALISGYHGLDASGGVATITNSGSITGTGKYGYGVNLLAGGSITNIASASIKGGTGIDITGGPETVVNGGGVTGSSGGGIKLGSGGTVSNTASSASIIGKYDGVSIGGAGMVVNNGIIAATAGNGVGVYFRSNGVVTNAASATITGHIGVDLYAGGTLTNAGSIIGSGGTASYLGGPSGNRLIIDPGAVFSGVVIGGTSTGNTLELASGSSAGTVSGLGTGFTGFDSTTIDADAAWTFSSTNTVSGTVTIAAGATLTNTGTLTLDDASVFATGSLVNDGTIVMDPSTLTAAALTGTGSVTLGSGSTLNAKGTVSAGETIAFAGTNAVLNILDQAGFAGTIQGQGPTDQVNISCFAAGTRVATKNGELAVEGLASGEHLRSIFGGIVPVVWLGHRRVDCRRHPRPADVWPVRIEAHAFGPDRPRRDLWLSPDHAVYLDDVLIPIRYLINGASITRDPRDHVTYFHVELPAHDVLLAEGLPCESYLDTGNRSAFANGGGAMPLHPDFALRVWEAEACAPLVVSGAKLATVKARLLARAEALGHATTDDPGVQMLADGVPTAPSIGADGRHRFVIPMSASVIRLLSRSAVAAEMVANSEDHRRLGVAVTGLWFDGTPVPLDDARLTTGWWPAEPGLRWTDGDAVLPPAREVALTLAPLLRYPLAHAA